MRLQVDRVVEVDEGVVDLTLEGVGIWPTTIAWCRDRVARVRVGD